MSPTTSEYEFELPSVRCSHCGLPPAPGREKAMKRCGTCLLVTYCVRPYQSPKSCGGMSHLNFPHFNSLRSVRNLTSTTIWRSATRQPRETHPVIPWRGVYPLRTGVCTHATGSNRIVACPPLRLADGCVLLRSSLAFLCISHLRTIWTTPPRKTSKVSVII